MTELPADLRVGAMRSRWHRLIKNARWYLVEPGRIAKIGWGDLGLDNLHELADTLEADQAFVVLAENPRGARQHLPFHDADDPPQGWCWYDRPE